MALQHEEPSGRIGPSFDPAAQGQPISEYLRRQRILRGMSREELSELTRIPIRSLERLEDGQFDGGSDGFVRGFVRTVAEALSEVGKIETPARLSGRRMTMLLTPTGTAASATT